MNESDTLDVFIDEIGQNISIDGPKVIKGSPADIPTRAIKLGLRLPSYLRRLENPQNSHDLCKSRMSKQVMQDSTAFIKAAIVKAQKLISKSSYLKAVTLLESLTEQGITHSDVYYLLGEAYRLLDEIDKAEEYLNKALLMKIHSPYCYFSLGKVFQAKEKYDESIKFFQKFLKRMDYPDGHYELGRSFMWLGYYEEAIEEYTNFIDVKKHLNLDPAVLLLRAEAYEAIDRPDLAQRDYRHVLRINPNYYSPYLEHAQELANAGRFQESKTIVEFVRYRSKYCNQCL